jgi:hypothetical protein
LHPQVSRAEPGEKDDEVYCSFPLVIHADGTVERCRKKIKLRLIADHFMEEGHADFLDKEKEKPTSADKIGCHWPHCKSGRGMKRSGLPRHSRMHLDLNTVWCPTCNVPVKDRNFTRHTKLKGCENGQPLKRPKTEKNTAPASA